MTARPFSALAGLALVLAGAAAQAQEPQLAPPAHHDKLSPTAAAADGWAERSRLLSEQPSLSGSTGGLRLSTAGSGAPGQLRASFLFDGFTASGFLCDKTNRAPAGNPVTCSRSDKSDDASRAGATFALNVTPVSFLEVFATVRLYESSNSEGDPRTLQVLGNSTFGIKTFFPRFGRYFTFGIEHQLLLQNSADHLGEGSSVGALVRGLFTADLRGHGGLGFPFRGDLNIGYKLDSSSALVTSTEKNRGKIEGTESQPISRIERFALGINRTDFFQLGIGATFPMRYVQPYAEYSVDVPIKSRDYQCRTSRVSRGDVCLDLADFSSPSPQTAGGPGYSAFPSRLSLGVRATPFSGLLRGLSGHAAVDIGLSGTRTFIEEVAPTPPWTLYLGLSYALDLKKKPQPEAAPPSTPK